MFDQFDAGPGDGVGGGGWCSEPPPLTVADILDAPDRAAAELAVSAPGPGACAAIELLDPVSLSMGGQVDLLVAVRRQLAWLEAVQARTLAALAADSASAAASMSESRLRRDPRRWVREEVACALAVHPCTAEGKLSDARQLLRLPLTARALYAGDLNGRQVEVIITGCERLTDADAATVEAVVLARAGGQTVGELRRSVRRAALRVAPVPAEEELVAARDRRRVEATPDPAVPGMSWLSAYLPAQDCAAVMACLTARARETTHHGGGGTSGGRGGASGGSGDGRAVDGGAGDGRAGNGRAGDGRTMDQRRADALTELALAGLADPHLPTQQGARPVVQVTVALSTLLGADERPGELAGHGPVPASVARRIAADPTGTWRRLVTDPLSGQLLDYGTTRYRPPPDLAEYVIARDQHCVFPTCTMPAHRCELDHRVAASAGGGTDPDNLGPLCKRHHIAKHEAGWRVTRNRLTGEYTWTSPTGHTYRSRPPDLPDDLGWPDTRPSAGRRPPPVASEASISGDDAPPPLLTGTSTPIWVAQGSSRRSRPGARRTARSRCRRRGWPG